MLGQPPPPPMQTAPPSAETVVQKKKATVRISLPPKPSAKQTIHITSPGGTQMNTPTAAPNPQGIPKPPALKISIKDPNSMPNMAPSTQRPPTAQIVLGPDWPPASAGHDQGVPTDDKIQTYLPPSGDRELGGTPTGGRQIGGAGTEPPLVEKTTRRGAIVCDYILLTAALVAVIGFLFVARWNIQKLEMGIQEPPKTEVGAIDMKTPAAPVNEPMEAPQRSSVNDGFVIPKSKKIRDADLWNTHADTMNSKVSPSLGSAS